MKKIIISIVSILWLMSSHSFSAENNRSLLEKIFNKDLPGGSNYKVKENKKPVIQKKDVSKISNSECKKINDTSLLEKILRKDLPGGNGKKNKCIKSTRQTKLKKTNPISSSLSSNDISLYTGTFDVIDKEGDDQTTLFGVEHKNPNLFRNTILGKFSPITGAFVTGDSSVYMYTGIEGQYGFGPIKILPSFSPGYYEKGDGKDLGSVLEFKSEVKVGFDIFENSKLSYSYSHISNNDWGETNPGTDNQHITFSKNF